MHMLLELCRQTFALVIICDGLVICALYQTLTLAFNRDYGLSVLYVILLINCSVVAYLYSCVLCRMVN